MTEFAVLRLWESMTHRSLIRSDRDRFVWRPEVAVLAKCTEDQLRQAAKRAMAEHPEGDLVLGSWVAQTRAHEAATRERLRRHAELRRSGDAAKSLVAEQRQREAARNREQAVLNLKQHRADVCATCDSPIDVQGHCRCS